MQFLNLDAGSEYSDAVKVTVLMREGKMTEARQAAQKMTESPMWMRGFLIACLDKAPQADQHRLAEQAENNLMLQHNSALKYYEGAVLAACGEKQMAFVFLQKAISERYCARESLQDDPLLAAVRQEPEFKGILESASQCEGKFKSAEGLR